ncbi:hypothetical protein AB0L75_35310 [Streptomyces sp. NPDC052101]|uniref:hypothetical protein n=1 Tax=Streptomyces sp. NPDC052101 TaxID=3155763 RepID=UPI003433AA74
MELGKAEPGVEQHAAAVADAVCELVDRVTPTTWSTGAVEDSADAIDMLAEALAPIGPETARTLAAVPAATTALRRQLTPGTTEDEGEPTALTDDLLRRQSPTDQHEHPVHRSRQPFDL